jgi:hypothetical protein
MATQQQNVETKEIVGRLVDLGEMALVWDQLRRESIYLRAQRNAILCDHEHEEEQHEQVDGKDICYVTRRMDDGVEDPCWKAREEPEGDPLDTSGHRVTLRAPFPWFGGKSLRATRRSVT